MGRSYVGLMPFEGPHADVFCFLVLVQQAGPGHRCRHCGLPTGLTDRTRSATALPHAMATGTQVRRRLPIMGPGPLGAVRLPSIPLSQVRSPVTVKEGGVTPPQESTVNDEDTEDENPSPASSQIREMNAVHWGSRYFNKADKRRRRAPPALPQPQEAGVGPSGAGPSGLGPTATAPPAAPEQAPAEGPISSRLRSRKRS